MKSKVRKLIEFEAEELSKNSNFIQILYVGISEDDKYALSLLNKHSLLSMDRLVSHKIKDIDFFLHDILEPLKTPRIFDYIFCTGIIGFGVYTPLQIRTLIYNLRNLHATGDGWILINYPITYQLSVMQCLDNFDILYETIKRDKDGRDHQFLKIRRKK